MCEWNALFGSLVRDGTEHTHIGGYGIMAPSFTEQPVFVLLDEAGGKLCKSDGTVADEAEKLFTVLVYIPDVLYRPACFVRCIKEAEKLCIVFII